MLCNTISYRSEEYMHGFVADSCTSTLYKKINKMLKIILKDRKPVLQITPVLALRIMGFFMLIDFLLKFFHSLTSVWSLWYTKLTTHLLLSTHQIFHNAVALITTSDSIRVSRCCIGPHWHPNTLLLSGTQQSSLVYYVFSIFFQVSRPINEQASQHLLTG